MEIAVISGKGGTGKSSISAAFAILSDRVVLADCDVDAANLYILFDPTHEEEQVYVSGQKAVIDESICTNCGLCIDYCRFDAISILSGKVVIFETSCDGCKLCSRVCPVGAISMIDEDKSRMYAGTFRNGKMVYGRLSPGEENSGKLVNVVREKAKQLASFHHLDTIIIDGPPGIGCPVISAITGVGHVVIVTEPTISGFHDMKRVLEITNNFKVKTYVVINKYDLNESISNEIENWCVENDIPVIGKIAFDPEIVTAMINCQSINEWKPESETSKEIFSIYNKIFNDDEKIT